jgi:parallel beta-helix repeat protein
VTLESNLRIWWIIPLLFVMVLFCPFADGKVIYVDDDAIGLNDGSSWQNAYTSLQDALIDANSAEKPVEIRVAQGIYKPDQGAGQTQGDREATFRLINDVNLIGGYAGLGQYNPNARDIMLYQTILSGDLDGNDVDVNTLDDLLDEPTRTENSYNIITFSGTYDDTAVLNGFTITAGNANGSYHPLNCGSGMYSRNSKPILNNCTFIGNAARDGGGMYNSNASRPVLTNCTFIGNSARVGGGLLNRYNNTKLTNCTFSGNIASEGGGMFNSHTVITLVENCLFSRNSAEHGGAIGNESSYTKLSNCTFEENRVVDYGGGISLSNSKSTLTNCIFCFNSGKNGNALACYSFNPAEIEIELTNCILWDDNNEIWNSSGITITISYSDIKGGQVSVNDPYEKIVWGTGNIDSDPCFADPANHDYHLKSQAGRWDTNNQIWIKDGVTSGCIDAGDPLTAIGYEPYPNGHRINMGTFGGTQQASMSTYDVNTFKPACAPNPDDGAVDVILDIMPSWISDPNAIMHDIYFGTSELPPFFRQQYQREFYPGALEPDTRYYWRIDDIDNLLNRAVGNIWTFLTGPQPAHAYGPSPVNGIGDVVAYRAILTWCPGLNAVKHNVYLGTDFNDVYQATTGNPLGVLVSAAQEPNFFNPGILEFEQIYYWRIDEIVGRGIITTGNTWMFTTGSQPVHAYNPNPPDKAMGVSPNVTLSWSPGKNAVSHDVYFGNTYQPHFVRNQTETDFNPGQLYPQGMLHSQERGYWRIDEIDSQGNITTGDVWTFQVHEYKGRLCFTGQTPVWTNDSLNPISKAGIGQSIDGIHRIEEVQEHEGTYTLYDILLESGNCITVAENHIFMIESGKWLSLHKLKAGMRLKTLKGPIGIQSITKSPYLYTGKVYNLKIRGSDRYMVGKDMVIVLDY